MDIGIQFGGRVVGVYFFSLGMVFFVCEFVFCFLYGERFVYAYLRAQN